MDLNLGGVTNVGLSNVNVVLTTGLASQASGLIIRLSGTLSANVSVTLPAVGSFYYVDNLCAGPFYVQLIAGAGQTIGVPQGSRSAIFTDGSNVKLADDGRDWPGAFKLNAGGLPNWFSAFTVQPWLYCSGQAVSRSTYSGLFSIIGTFFGSGDGTTTFNVPDLRGRIPLPFDDGAGRITVGISGISPNTLGSSGGNQGVALTTPNLPPYTPSGSVSSSFSGSADTRFGFFGGGGIPAFAPPPTGAGISATSVTGTVSSSFGGTPQGGSSSQFSVVPPALVSGIWLIKT